MKTPRPPVGGLLADSVGTALLEAVALTVPSCHAVGVGGVPGTGRHLSSSPAGGGAPGDPALLCMKQC